ncbi:MAG: FHA domain-containing protein [Cyanobacteria bacterium SZAS-4]|nr:FHA domain-containing protein [Cyanobacteria bacterium SZAS-4]
MESNCPVCKKPYDGVVCTQCTVTDLDMGGLMAGEGLSLKSEEDPGNTNATAYLVDLVSNRKIPITAPRCKVGRDDLNDIVISGDQSISRFHFVITKENNQYMVQDGKSRHGTFLNGNQITVPEPIHDGDVLKVGVSLFWFVIEMAVAANAPEVFAPVDIGAMEQQQQELEFVLPEPSNPQGTREMSLPDAASVSIAPKGESPKKPLDKSEITVAMLLDPLQQKELDKAVTKAAEKQQTESAKVDATSSKLADILKGPDPANSADTKADAKAGSKDDDSKADASKAVESAKDNAGKTDNSKSLADTTHANLAAVEAEKAAGAEALTKPEEKDEMASDVVAPEIKKFTEFDDNYSDQKSFSEYTYGINDLFDPLRKVASALSAARDEESESKSDEDLVSTESKADEVSKVEAEEAKKAEEVEPVKAEFEPTTAKELEEETIAAEKSKSEESKSVDTKSKTEETKVEAPKSAAEPMSTLESIMAGEFEPVGEVKSKLHEEPEVAATSTPSTLDKFAEIIGEVSGNTEKKIEEPASSLKLNFQSSSDKVEREESKREDEARVEASTTNGESQTSNGAKGMSIIKEAGSSTVPDWCKKYFSSELNSLSKELTELNEQVRLAQQKIKEVESRVALTKGLRNTLLTAQGEELVEACGKVLTMLGWRVKISEEDKHELRLDTSEDKNVSIARIVWTESQADRTHLGQLSISQTRYWCEQGVEPKGILLVCKSGDTAPSPLNSSDFNSELAEYASKKNVCLMTTLQLLSVYKEIALHDGSAETVRATILASSGWLPGFNLEPGAESADKEESSGTNKLSSLLSA